VKFALHEDGKGCFIEGTLTGKRGVTGIQIAGKQGDLRMSIQFHCIFSFDLLEDKQLPPDAYFATALRKASTQESCSPFSL
jgi:hypothetical protein